MKKILTYLVFSLLYFSVQSQIIPIVKWNINPDANNSFFLHNSVNSSAYFANPSFGLTESALQGAFWNQVPTGSLNPNGIIKIGFTVSSGYVIDMTDIQYSAASLNGHPLFRVEHYGLKYVINGTDTTTVIELPDGNLIGTSGNGPYDSRMISLPTPEVLEAGDTFELIWYPFDASSSANPSATAFYLADTTKVGAIPIMLSAIVHNAIGTPVSNFEYETGCASAGSLSWINPIDMINKQVVVFAKKTTYIIQGNPLLDPSFYGAPLADLSQMNPSVPLSVQYENDADAMLIYRGTGSSVNLTNFDNGIDYQFAAFVVDGTTAPAYVYSNAKLTIGNSPSALNEIVSYTALSKPTAADLTFVQPNCFDKIVIVANAGNAITTPPSGTNSFTANSVWAGTNDYLGGQVMYNGVGTGVNLTNLTNGQQYGISIWIESAGNWSIGTFFSVYPDNYEVIFTQEKSVDVDAVEFLTLKEIDFSAANYNLGSNPTCEDGLQRISGFVYGDEVGETFFDNILINGVSEEIPAGTYVRVYSGTGTDDLEANDGIVTLYGGTNLALRDNGDQAMLFIGNGVGGSDVACGTGTPNSFKSAINFGNNGWLSPGSGTNPDGGNSYAPPSVSNLAQPAVIPDLYPNYSLKDQYSISGDIAAIHSEISQTDNSSIWFANNESNLAIIKLKDIQIDPTNFTSASSTWLTSSIPGEVDIDLSLLTFDDEVDTRYMVVVNSVLDSDLPADRYTCYSPISTDYLATSPVVLTVGGQDNATPCGTPVTGLGHVVYLNRNKTATITVTNLPCGTRVFADVYAVKGNGYTMSLGLPASSDVLLDIATPTDYYSQASGNIGDTDIWDLVPGGGTPVTLTEFSPCVNLIIQTGHTVTFDPLVTEIGCLKVETGATAEVVASNFLTIERDLDVQGTFTPNQSTVVLSGDYGDNGAGFGAQVVTGASAISFYILWINNLSPTSGAATDNDVNFNVDANVTYGMRVFNGDLLINALNTITLVSTIENYAAYLGEMGATATIIGNINAQRYLPPITGVGEADASIYGTGWRYLGIPVENADFTQISDDFFTAGYIGSDFPLFYDEAGYYFPTIKKYDETVSGTISEGFDNDPHPVNGVPEIRFRRDASTSDIDVAPGEGVLAYISSHPSGNQNSGIYDVIGQPITGDVDVVLSYTASGGTATDYGWHMVANPYPCAVDWKEVFFTSTGGFNDGTIYIKNTEAGATPEYVELNKSAIVPQYIASHQAFWIKTSFGEITLQFREEDKIENPSGNFYKNNDEIYQESIFVKIENDSDTLARDRAIVWFMEEATFEFNTEYDSYKLRTERAGTPIISSNIDGFDKTISTNAIPSLEEDHVITFNMEIREAGNYTLTFEEHGYILEGSCVTMTDLVNDSTFSVDQSTVYSFYSELRADTTEAMFSMTISPSVSIESTDLTCFEGANGTATALGVGDGPFTYTWYNANNEVILTETSSNESTINELTQGFYSVEIDGNNTFCNLTSNEIYITQPTAFENDIYKVDPLSCSYADGSIEVSLDSRAIWDVTWMNIETGQTNQALGQTDAYTIANLGAGTYEVILTTDCGAPFIFEETLVDNNDVVANFTLEADTIWLADGGTAQFYNTSENSSNWFWLYSSSSVEPDDSFDGNYTYTEPGVYGVTLIAQNESTCSDIITQEIVVMADPSGVDDLSNGIVRAYISYSNGSPQYVIELLEDKEVNIQMLNTMGQVISSQEVNVSGKTFVDLPTYDLSSGVYLIITLADGTQIDTQKLFVR